MGDGPFRRPGAPCQSADANRLAVGVQFSQALRNGLTVLAVDVAHVCHPVLHTWPPADGRGSYYRGLIIEWEHAANAGIGSAAAVGEVAGVSLPVSGVASIRRGDDDVDAIAGHQGAHRL